MKKREIVRRRITPKDNDGKAMVHKAYLRVSPIIALEEAVRYNEKCLEFKKQHGQVKVIMKDGKLV